MGEPQKTPAYVATILTNRLQLAGSTIQVKKRLNQSPWGEQCYRDDKLRLWVPFDEHGELLHNPQLVDLLKVLQQWGVCFLENPEEGVCPAEWVRALIGRGVLPNGFKSIYFMGEQFQLFDH